ncbi:MAG: PGPGW domain-containing protein [Mariprofundus sp.]|nr:PGPGW domain-containing protein [Mariprofundus sp.]
METVWIQMVAFSEARVWWIIAASVVMFVVSLAAMPLIVARIPEDYFTHHGRHRMSQNNHGLAKGLLLAGLKNMFGAMLLVAGFIMLFTPGQGLLSMLFGLMIMNYPGKYKLECWIIRKPMISRTLNFMRAKQGKAPLLEPEVD